MSSLKPRLHPDHQPGKSKCPLTSVWMANSPPSPGPHCPGGFPHGPVVKSSHVQFGGMGLIPGQGGKIPHASHCVKNKQNCPSWTAHLPQTLLGCPSLLVTDPHPHLCFQSNPNPGANPLSSTFRTHSKSHSYSPLPSLPLWAVLTTHSQPHFLQQPPTGSPEDTLVPQSLSLS